jgi:hypothetical protein
MNYNAVFEKLWPRIRKASQKWPRPLCNVFREYLAGKGKPFFDRIQPGRDILYYPFWLLMPGWLLDRSSQDLPKNIPKLTLLEDILYAQLCLVLFVRIHDDLADDPSQRSFLAVAAFQLLIDSEMVFCKYLGQANTFSSLFHEALRTTSFCAIQLEFLERDPDIKPDRIMRLYAKEAAVLLLGSRVIGFLAGSPDDIREIQRFGGAMTVSGQLLDDLRDLEEDLAQGKINLAASILMRASNRAGLSVQLTRESLVEAGIFSGGFQDVLNVVARQLVRAKTAAHELKIQAAVPWVERYQTWPKNMRARICNHGIEDLFSSLNR